MLVSLWLLLNVGTIDKPIVVTEVIAFNGFFACDAARAKLKTRYGAKLKSADCIGSKHGDVL